MTRAHAVIVEADPVHRTALLSAIQMHRIGAIDSLRFGRLWNNIRGASLQRMSLLHQLAQKKRQIIHATNGADVPEITVNAANERQTNGRK